MARTLDQYTTFDDSGLRRRLAKLSDGATERFFKRGEKDLRPIAEAAAAVWPRGNRGPIRSADHFRIERRFPQGSVQVAIVNRARKNGRYYSHYVKFSVRTARSLEREAASWATRGRTPAAAEKIRAFALMVVQGSHGKGAPTPQLAGKRAWPTLVRTPGKRAAKKAIPDLEKDILDLAKG